MRRRKSELWPAFFVNIGLALTALLTAAPLLWMLSVSLMPTGEANSLPPRLLPSAPTLAHYREIFVHLEMGRYLWNSLVLSTSITLLSVLLCALAGYAFAKLRFRGRDRLFGAILLLLVVPAQVGMLPLFLMLKHLGLINTLAGAMVPSGCACRWRCPKAARGTGSWMWTIPRWTRWTCSCWTATASSTRPAWATMSTEPPRSGRPART